MQKVSALRNDNRDLWTKNIFSIRPDEAQQRLKEGKPLINLQHDNFSDDLPKRYFLDLLTITKKDHPRMVNNLQTVITADNDAYTKLVRTTFSQTENAESNCSENPGETENSFDLIPFFLQESLKPFFSYLALKQKKILDQTHWQHGICPICSRSADLSLLRAEEGKRSLFCLQCDFEWPCKRLQCPFCKNEEQSKLDYFTIDDQTQKHYRVDVCRQCQRFIKTIDTRIPTGEINLEIENLITIHLELEAVREGFR